MEREKSSGGRGAGEQMKRSLEWHIGCLLNQAGRLAVEEERLADFQRRVAQMRSDWRFYYTQIERAKTEGWDGFDSEKFRIKGRAKLQ